MVVRVVEFSVQATISGRFYILIAKINSYIFEVLAKPKAYVIKYVGERPLMTSYFRVGRGV